MTTTKIPAILTGTEFRRIGELIGGVRWQKELAPILKRSPRSLQYYLTGKVNVPADVRRRLASAAAIKSEELNDLAQELLS